MDTTHIRPHGIIAAAIAAALTLALLGCSATDAQPEPVEGERWASSMQELAQFTLDESDGLMSDTQLAVVHQVLQTGEVDVADYEHALSEYRQCMLDLGYKEIIFVDMGGGLKAETSHQSGTDEQERKYGEDQSTCISIHTRAIGFLYEKQVGNVNLYKDHNEAIADCLRREGLVDMSYTGKQFAEEFNQYRENRKSGDSGEWTFSYDESDEPTATICKYSNGILQVDNTWPIEHLW